MREARSVFAGIGFAEEIQYAEMTRLRPLRPGWCPIGFARIAACKALSRTLRDCRFVPSSRTRAESGGADKQGSQ